MILCALAGTGLLHALADFLTHHDDACRQFWPVSDSVFRSPVSYWDSRFYGDIFGVFEVALELSLTAVLCWRMSRWLERVLLIGLAAFVVVSVILSGGLQGLYGPG